MGDGLRVLPGGEPDDAVDPADAGAGPAEVVEGDDRPRRVPPGTPVTARAPGKVNLALRVGGLRPDRSHELVTVFEAVALHEDVRAVPCARLECAVAGEGAEGLPTDERNLAVRAALLLAERAGVPPRVRLEITKQVPVAGGMAGGSADAAAALVACDALWGTGLGREDLLALGAELGADVPFALVGGTAVGTGRGERVVPALARGTRSWVLALAGQGLSTPAVFGELDRQRAAAGAGDPAVGEEDVRELLVALAAGDPAAVGAALVNDLEAPALALAPALARTLEVGREAGALAALVSGSGPTTAFLVADREQGLDVAVALTASGAAADVRRVHGPAPGARLVDVAR